MRRPDLLGQAAVLPGRIACRIASRWPGCRAVSLPTSMIVDAEAGQDSETGVGNRETPTPTGVLPSASGGRPAYGTVHWGGSQTQIRE